MQLTKRANAIKVSVTGLMVLAETFIIFPAYVKDGTDPFGMLLLLAASLAVLFTVINYKTNGRASIYYAIIPLALVILSMLDGVLFPAMGRAMFRFCLFLFWGAYALKVQRNKPSLRSTIFDSYCLYIIVFAPPLIFFSDEIFKPIIIAPLVAILPLCWISKADNWRPRLMASSVALVIGIYFSYGSYTAYLKGKTFSAKTENPEDERYRLLVQDAKGNKLTLHELRGKVVILDLWFSGCAICFDEFPKFQALSDQYKNRKDVFVASLNLPLPNESLGKPFKLVNGYNFNKLVALDNIESDKWRVQAFPALLIFDKDGTLRYQGANNMEINALLNNVPKMIQSLAGREAPRR